MPQRPDRKREYMKRKGLRVIRRGAVLEGELPKALTRQGPKWLKTWPKVRLIRSSKPEARRSRADLDPASLPALDRCMLISTKLVLK